MTDKVQLIRQEIERRIDLYSIAEKDDSIFARMGELSSLMDFIDSLPEENHFEDKSEMVSEDLEEEIENYIKESLAVKFPTIDKEQIKADIRYIARHFAEWQKKKDQETIELAEDHAMLAGMNRMKEEMMKDAVETTIVNDWQYGKDPDHAIIPAIHQRIEGFNIIGDKVKIIIVKPEQQ